MLNLKDYGLGFILGDFFSQKHPVTLFLKKQMRHQMRQRKLQLRGGLYEFPFHQYFTLKLYGQVCTYPRIMGG
jgi:hypothetical protein